MLYLFNFRRKCSSEQSEQYSEQPNTDDQTDAVVRASSAKKYRKKLVKDHRSSSALQRASSEEEQDACVNLRLLGSVSDGRVSSETRKREVQDTRQRNMKRSGRTRKHRSVDRSIDMLETNTISDEYGETADSMSDSTSVSEHEIRQLYLTQNNENDAGTASLLPPAFIRKGNEQFLKVKVRPSRPAVNDSQLVGVPSDDWIAESNVINDEPKRRGRTKKKNLHSRSSFEERFEQDVDIATGRKKNTRKGATNENDASKHGLTKSVTNVSQRIKKLERNAEKETPVVIRENRLQKLDRERTHQRATTDRARGLKIHRRQFERSLIGFVSVEDAGTFKTLKSSTLLKSNPKLVKVKVHANVSMHGRKVHGHQCMLHGCSSLALMSYLLQHDTL